MAAIDPTAMISGLGRVATRLDTLATPSRWLRWSLGCIYLWFGVLKLLDISPAVSLVGQAYPPFIAVPLYCGLAFFEVAVGILFLAGLWTRWTLLAAAVHLLGTFGTLILAPSVVFLERFPFLTMEGEFVVKNLVLLAALYAIWKLEIEGAAEPDHSRAYAWTVWSLIVTASLLLTATGAWLAGQP